MVSTSRCGRDNPGSNPGYSKFSYSLIRWRGQILRTLAGGLSEDHLVLICHRLTLLSIFYLDDIVKFSLLYSKKKYNNYLIIFNKEEIIIFWIHIWKKMKDFNIWYISNTYFSDDLYVFVLFKKQKKIRFKVNLYWA